MAPARLGAVVAIGLVAGAAGHQVPGSQPTFRVAVDVITIDAVVTDDGGRIVPDLTADDFEVYQNGRKQRVTTATFVPVATAAVPTAPAAGAGPNSARNAGTRGPAPQIVREHVGRTIVIVVDDLGLSGQGLLRLLPALRRFVDVEVLPTDAVAIVRTGESNGMVQAITRDRDALRAAIDALRYNGLSRKGPWAMGDVTQLGNSPPQFDGPERPLATLESLSALNFVVRAARDLPGRKTVVIASEGFQLNAATAAATMFGHDSRVRDAIERVADQAVRSGVVLYALDCTGLETGGLRASDDIHYVPDMTAAVNRFSAARLHGLRDAQESLAYLTEQTGGLAVVNTNDLAKGLARIGSDIRDYYIIGYAPEPETFAVDARLARRHAIAVKVKRPGLRVRTRRAFTGISDPEGTADHVTPAQALVRAAMSPFSASTIGLQATNLAGYWPDRGLFIRSILHLDGRALTFESDGNSRRGTVDLVGLVFDSDGAQVHDISTGFDVEVESRAVGRVVEDGLVYVARIPIAKPGGYQVRFAVRDRRSGRIGTGGGFVLVPDVSGGAFALSGLVVRTHQEGTAAEGLQSDRFSVPPTDARRAFARGTTLSYSYQVYNGGDAVTSRASLWQGDHRVMETAAAAVPPPRPGLPGTAAGQITLDAGLTPGAYVLQVSAVTAGEQGTSKQRTAVQRTSFDVR